MGQETGHSDTAAGGWTETARYRALISIDRRRWAWLWLKRISTIKPPPGASRRRHHGNSSGRRFTGSSATI